LRARGPRPYLDKKSPRVQVGAKQAVSPPGIFFSGMLKKDLFTGRKEELAYFRKWINGIKERKSQSTAILARRKMGKTALLERLFNITFYKNNGVIPY
jgi:hypothetical protein